MKFIKLIFSWQLVLSFILASIITYALLYYTFIWLRNYTEFAEEIEVPKIKGLKISKGIKILKNFNLNYQIDSFKYDSNYRSFEILHIYPEEGTKIKKGRKIFIRCNPKTWPAVALPNLIDKSKYLAFSQMNMLGLKIGDTIYKEDIAENRIIKMLYKKKEIKAGEFVPKYSKIDLVIGSGLLKDISVPDLIGLNYFEAKNILKQNTFEEGLVSFTGDKDTINARIYYQDPLPKSKLDQGLSINIWLSTINRENLREQISILNQLYNPKISMDTLRYLRNKHSTSSSKKSYQVNKIEKQTN